MKRFSKELKLEIVKSIVSGQYLIEEVSAYYGVKSLQTLRRWLKLYHVEAKLQLYREQVDPGFNVGPENKEVGDDDRHDLHAEEQIKLLYDVITLHERIHVLEEMNKTLIRCREDLLSEIFLLKQNRNG